MEPIEQILYICGAISDICNGRRAINSDNDIPKDRPRLKRTKQANAAIVILHSAIIKTHSRNAHHLNI